MQKKSPAAAAGSDLSLSRKKITSMKGASAGYRTALAPFMPVIFILLRLRSIARPAASCGFFFMIPQPAPV